MSVGTEFPPVALYLVLSLAITVLSMAVNFYREAKTEEPLEGLDALLRSSAVWSIFAWSHVALYLIWQLFTPAEDASIGHTIHQFLHLLVLSLFGSALARVGSLWAGKSIAQTILDPEGE